MATGAWATGNWVCSDMPPLLLRGDDGRHPSRDADEMAEKRGRGRLRLVGLEPLPPAGHERRPDVLLGDKEGKCFCNQGRVVTRREQEPGIAHGLGDRG